jgi:hypothetical protein
LKVFHTEDYTGKKLWRVLGEETTLDLGSAPRPPRKRQWKALERFEDRQVSYSRGLGRALTYAAASGIPWNDGWVWLIREFCHPNAGGLDARSFDVELFSRLYLYLKIATLTYIHKWAST